MEHVIYPKLVIPPIPKLEMGQVVRLVDNEGRIYDNLYTFKGLICIMNGNVVDCQSYWREFENGDLESLAEYRKLKVQYIWDDIYNYVKDVPKPS